MVLYRADLCRQQRTSCDGMGERPAALAGRQSRSAEGDRRRVTRSSKSGHAGGDRDVERVDAGEVAKHHVTYAPKTYSQVSKSRPGAPLWIAADTLHSLRRGAPAAERSGRRGLAQPRSPRRRCVHWVSLKTTFTVVSTSTGCPFSRYGR